MSDDVLKELESLGTAQNRKVYARHGVGPAMYGVSYAHLGKLAKRLSPDTELARRLWASGNHDARVLATMVADPGEVSARELDAWARNLDNYVLTDALSSLAAKTPHARRKCETWTAAGRGTEWTEAAGWNVVSILARNDADLPDAYFEERLRTIEEGIHGRRNRVRHSMNQALIAIGVRNPGLQERAVAAAGRIGKVEVDHGETGCKTPDAAAYIAKTVARKEAKERKAAGKRKGA